MEGTAKEAQRLLADERSMRNLAQTAEGRAATDRLRDMSRYVSNGYVPIQAEGVPPETARQVRSIVDKFQIPVTESKYSQWINYDAAMKSLRAMSQATLKTVGEMLHNEGKVKRG